MRATIGPKSFAQYGDTQSKGSQSTTFRQRYPQLFNLLDSVPFQAFSPVGKRNVSRRFHLTEQELEGVILTYERPDEPTEAERRAADLAHLLGVIEAAVTPARKPTAQKGKAKKGGVRK